MQQKQSVKELKIKHLTDAIQLVDLTSIKQLTHLELVDVTYAIDIAVIGKVICDLENIYYLKVKSDPEINRSYSLDYSDLLKWMESDCTHGNCLLNKIKVWPMIIRWSELESLPSNTLQKIGIVPFQTTKDLEANEALFAIILSKSRGIFPDINSCGSFTNFRNFLKVNGHLVKVIGLYNVRNGFTTPVSMLSLIHSLPNLRIVRLDHSCVTPNTPFLTSRYFPHLIDFDCHIEYSGFLIDILSHSPNLTHLRLFNDNDSPLTPTKLRKLLPTKLAKIKNLLIFGRNLLIGENEINYIQGIAPELEILGNLESWQNITPERIAELQEETQCENLLITFQKSTYG